jgi:hypothetical protein
MHSVTGVTGVWVIVGLMVLVVVFLMGMLAKMFRKAGPHEAIIVYGFRGTRIVKGGGTIIFPMVESAKELSLELMSFDVAPQQDLYTKQGVAVTVEAVAQIKVKSDRESVRTAAEQFLTNGRADRQGTGNGWRPHAIYMRCRHEQDGTRRRELHDQGSARQERVHHQHGASGRGADQAGRGRRRCRSGSRYGHQAG